MDNVKELVEKRLEKLGFKRSKRWDDLNELDERIMPKIKRLMTSIDKLCDDYDVEPLHRIRYGRHLIAEQMTKALDLNRLESIEFWKMLARMEEDFKSKLAARRLKSDKSSDFGKRRKNKKKQ